MSYVGREQGWPEPAPPRQRGAGFDPRQGPRGDALHRDIGQGPTAEHWRVVQGGTDKQERNWTKNNVFEGIVHCFVFALHKFIHSSIPGHAGGSGLWKPPSPQPPDPIVVAYKLYVLVDPPLALKIRGVRPPYFSRRATTTSLTFQIPSSTGENNADISLKWKRRRWQKRKKGDTKKGTSFFLSCHRKRDYYLAKEEEEQGGGFREACFVG